MPSKEDTFPLTLEINGSIAHTKHREIFDTQNNGIPVSSENSESVQKNTGFVLKIIQPTLERNGDETEEEYKNRCKNEALETVTKKNIGEQKVLDILGRIAPEILVPKEQYFIMEGMGGLPVAASVQQKIEGVTLEQFGLSNLNIDPLIALQKLLLADIEFYNETGIHFDIRGFSTNSPEYSKLNKTLLGELATSTNIMISKDGRVVFVDAEPLDRKNTIKRIKISTEQLRLLLLKKGAEIENYLEEVYEHN